MLAPTSPTAAHLDRWIATETIDTLEEFTDRMAAAEARLAAAQAIVACACANSAGGYRTDPHTCRDCGRMLRASRDHLVEQAEIALGRRASRVVVVPPATSPAWRRLFRR